MWKRLADLTGARKLSAASLAVLILCATPPAGTRPAPRVAPDDPKELEALLDPVFAAQMEKLHIPGAVVAVVSGGRLVFAKGYGHADVEKKTPVVADKTIFRVGSITKVFTAVAVVQLAERGRISLSDDVNKHLKGVRVPETYTQPVTFAHLLTHTSGLDEISPGRRTSDESQVVPLGAFLKTRIVRRLSPGDHISYSTYNPALAAHAVEQITQKPFKEYLRENVFEPLGMSRTSITTVPESLRADLATGYEYAEGSHRKLPFQWFHTYPASDVNSTATDMARFMLAHLSRGAYGGGRILSEKSAREMQRTHFRNHPRLSGWAYGFYETRHKGLRVVEHGGSMDDGYSALMSLVPEKDFGVFVACNTETGGFGLAGAVKDSLLDRYFPPRANKQAARPRAPARASLERFAGKYRADIYCHTCPPGSGAYLPQPFEVVANTDGTLSFWDTKWKQVEPSVFESADGPRAGQVLVAFRADRAGRVTYMFQDTWAFERVPDGK